MTRSEFGNFLGLSVETISRLLSKFDKDDIINVEGKLITIVDSETLEEKSKTFSPKCMWASRLNKIHRLRHLIDLRQGPNWQKR